MKSIIVGHKQIQVDTLVSVLFNSDFPTYLTNRYIDDPPAYAQKLVDKVLTFANYYIAADDKTKAILDDISILYNAKSTKANNTTAVRDWCTNIVDDVKDPEEIKEFITIADASGNDSLHSIACAIIALDIEHLEVEQFRTKYGFKSDFNEEDLNQLKEEDEIWNTISEQ